MTMSDLDCELEAARGIVKRVIYPSDLEDWYWAGWWRGALVGSVGGILAVLAVLWVVLA